jgi:hypothetical protein
MGDVVHHMQSPFHNGHKCKLLYYFLIRSYSLNWDLHPGVGLRPSLVIPYGFSGGADTIHPAFTHQHRREVLHVFLHAGNNYTYENRNGLFQNRSGTYSALCKTNGDNSG